MSLSYKGRVDRACAKTRTANLHMTTRICFPFVLSLALAWLASPPIAASAQAPDLEAYRKHALTKEGDAGRGQKIFNDVRALCSNCHSVDGKASKAGPDLQSAGDAFGRRDLVEAVLQPSKTIAPGY